MPLKPARQWNWYAVPPGFVKREFDPTFFSGFAAWFIQNGTGAYVRIPDEAVRGAGGLDPWGEPIPHEVSIRFQAETAEALIGLGIVGRPVGVDISDITTAPPKQSGITGVAGKFADAAGTVASTLAIGVVVFGLVFGAKFLKKI